MVTTLLGTLLLLAAAALFVLTGCASPKVESYAEAEPKLDIRVYVDGKMKAYGTIEDITGEVVSRFTADITGSWDGNVGTLDEQFVFEDGKTEERIWTLTMQDDHNFTGTAHDVIGESVGKQYGNALQMRYTLRRDINGRTLDFSMDDWMYLIDEKHLINKTVMRKFGIPVAKLTIGFYKD